MQSALQEQNGDAVRKLAHKMKSSSANLGAVQLATLAARIEKNQIPANVDILRTLQHAYNRVAKELRAVLNGGPA